MRQNIPAKEIFVSINPVSGAGKFYIAESISYSFQIAEYVDSNNKVVKSRLEVSRNLHDQYGTIIQSDPFAEVPRVQRPL